jgi:hypothetical protein
MGSGTGESANVGSRDTHEPTNEELALAARAFEIRLVSFSRTLEKLEPTDYLPRYNRLILRIQCCGAYSPRPLFVTVRRHGSTLGSENYYTVPFFAGKMAAGERRQYELLSFDSFNLSFESVTVEMCRPEDYSKRRVSLAHIGRATRFATLVPGVA